MKVALEKSPFACHHSKPYTIPEGAIHITLQKPKGKTIVIGDIHGCFEELKNLLDKCKWDKENDLVIVVGDLVNKGPYSNEVVSMARENGFYVVKGNHDDYALSWYDILKKDKEVLLPLKVGWLTGFSEENAEYLRNLPYTITLPYEEVIVVHAGIIPNIPLKDQDYSTMYKIRNIVEVVEGIKYKWREKF